MLRVEDLTVSFPTDDGLVQAVRGVSYTVREREVLGIVGESGSGKSVSSLAIMGLIPKSARVSGRIVYRGDDVLSMSQRAQRRLRGSKLAMVFQDPMTAMNPRAHRRRPDRRDGAQPRAAAAQGGAGPGQGRPGHGRDTPGGVAACGPTRTSSPGGCASAR